MRPDWNAGGFAAGLLDADLPVPEGVVDPEGASAPKRYAVYRNNVTVSLTEAVAAAYPAVQALVGEDFFRQMARLYVESNPPKSPLMLLYAADFPTFLEAFEPAQGLPFLPDVARIDRTWLEAYHAKDAPVLGPADVAGMDEIAFGTLVLTPHPAARLVASGFPAVDLWQAGRTGNAAAGIDPEKSQTALVTRPALDVAVTGLEGGMAMFITRLFAGDPIGVAAGAAGEADAAFDPVAAILFLLGCGAFLPPQGEDAT